LPTRDEVHRAIGIDRRDFVICSVGFSKAEIRFPILFVVLLSPLQLAQQDYPVYESIWVRYSATQERRKTMREAGKVQILNVNRTFLIVIIAQLPTSQSVNFALANITECS
jgi:hypothetical protein